MSMRIWFWPLLLATLGSSGLVIGLVFDGAGDLFAWLGLGLPVALSAWHGWLRR
jgi:hypothetical protein